MFDRPARSKLRGVNHRVSQGPNGGSRAPGVIVFGQIAQRLLTQAQHDQVDVSAVIRRPGVRTALIVDIVDSSGQWRYLEDIPAEMLLTEGDVRTCRHLLLPGRWVSVQLQQPPAAAMAVAVSAHHAGCKVVLDGAPAGKRRAGLLAAADVLRADAQETELLAGSAVTTAAEAEKLASDLLRQGPSLVALAVPGIGNLIAWPECCLLLPLPDAQVVDTTGAGDAFTAGLIMALAQGGGPQRAAGWRSPRPGPPWATRAADPPCQPRPCKTSSPC